MQYAQVSVGEICRKTVGSTQKFNYYKLSLTPKHNTQYTIHNTQCTNTILLESLGVISRSEITPYRIRFCSHTVPKQSISINYTKERSTPHRSTPNFIN